MIEKNLSLLHKFESLSKENPGPIPYSVQLGNPSSNKKLFICAATHGNEVGSIPAVIDAIGKIKKNKLRPDCQLVIALGNIEAIKINKRYVEEDMNRAYGREKLDTVDAKRANEVGKMIAWADLFVDLHQTIEPTKGSFYVIRNDKTSIHLCQALALSEHAIVIDDNKAETKNRITGTSFALQNNTPAFTIELSHKGYSDQAEALATSTIENVINFVNQNELSNLESLAEKAKPLQLLDVCYAHKFTHPEMYLVDGLQNLGLYKKDEVLGYDGKEEIRCPFDGYIFFPKYPERDDNGKAIGILPTNIFMLAKKM